MRRQATRHEKGQCNMPHLFIVYDRSTGAELGRGTWKDVNEARRLAARQGIAADVRRGDVSHGDRRALYDVARADYRARILGAK